MNNYALNITAGKEFEVAVKIAAADTKLMQEERILQCELAEAQKSMQEACYHSAWESAKSAKTALDKEATGLDAAGTAGAVTSGLSIASLLPHQVWSGAGIKFGSDATHEELENVNAFHDALNNTTPRILPGARVTNNGPTGNTTVDQWLGHGRDKPNVSAFNAVHDQAHINSLDSEQLEKVKAHVVARRNELNEKIHNHSSTTRSNFAGASNNYGSAAGNLAQGAYKQDQAQYDKKSKVDSAENQLEDQINNAIANSNQQTDQAAANFSEAGLSILANLNTQG